MLYEIYGPNIRLECNSFDEAYRIAKALAITYQGEQVRAVYWESAEVLFEYKVNSNEDHLVNNNGSYDEESRFYSSCVSFGLPGRP